MPYYRRVGDVPRKRHTLHRGADGSIQPEELMGVEGFSSASSLLYHRLSPSAIVAAEPVADQEPLATPNEPLLPHHLRTPDLPSGGDLVSGRHRLLANADVAVSFAAAKETSGLYRDASGDELVYVQSGSGVLESVFGRLEVSAGDYVVIPMSTTHRWVVAGSELLTAMIFATAGHVQPPSKYLTSQGQLLEGAPYSERDQRGPDGLVQEDGEDVEVLVRHRGGMTRYTYAHHPFDLVGWDGCLYPWALSIHDFEPIVGRIHQPPPVHQTFAAPNLVFCSFVPRLFDTDPNAVKIPYHHANVDSDEVLFYSAGNFMSRAGSGIGMGSISLHPAGFVHGPQPGSLERSMDQDHTEELAVMLDTFRPLGLTDAARSVSDPDYPWSWSGGRSLSPG